MTGPPCLHRTPSQKLKIIKSASKQADSVYFDAGKELPQFDSASKLADILKIGAEKFFAFYDTASMGLMISNIDAGGFPKGSFAIQLIHRNLENNCFRCRPEKSVFWFCIETEKIGNIRCIVQK